jgi:hypothetical protein
MATVSIQVPTLETNEPVHTVAHARCLKGWKGDARELPLALVTSQG